VGRYAYLGSMTSSVALISPSWIRSASTGEPCDLRHFSPPAFPVRIRSILGDSNGEIAFSLSLHRELCREIQDAMVAGTRGVFFLLNR
jgi:hypothetical protein